MTILIGAVVDKHILIGADSLWTWSEDFVRESRVSKFIELPSNEILIATSGQDRFTQIFEKIISKDSQILEVYSRKDVRKLVDAFYREVEKYGIGESENNQLPDHELGFLVASKYTNRLWTVESDYSVQEYDDYVCMGSGSFLGESAMRTLMKTGITGKQAIYTAIETVCELHPFCGGRIEIRQLELEAVVDKESNEVVSDESGG